MQGADAWSGLVSAPVTVGDHPLTILVVMGDLTFAIEQFGGVLELRFHRREGLLGRGGPGR